MKALTALFATAAFVAAAGSASAAPIYASEVLDVNAGAGQTGAASRYVPTNALGAPDESFYSLGLSGPAGPDGDGEGSIVLGFGGQSFGGSTVTAYEVTFNLNNYGEAVDVFAAVWDGISLSATDYIGRVLNTLSQDGESLTYAGGLNFNALYLVDATLDEFGGDTDSFDGYDLDAVSISPVPLPAAGLLLLGGLGGLGLVRRKKA